MTPLDVPAAATAGLVSTVAMTLFEFPFWKRWGLKGVAEWQTNWVIVFKVTRRKSGIMRDPVVSWIIAAHLFHGVVAGVVFGILSSLFIPLIGGRAPILSEAIIYSVVLWLIFSVMLKKTFEAAGSTRIYNSGVLLALLSHLIYGVFLGLLLPVL